jgi:hypothetical protein
MDLAEISENLFYVVEEIRTLRMPRQFGLDPGFAVGHSLSQGPDALTQIFDLCPHFVTLSLDCFQLAQLALNPFQFLGSIGIVAIAIPVLRVAPAFNHGKQEVSAGKHGSDIDGFNWMNFRRGCRSCNCPFSIS